MNIVIAKVHTLSVDESRFTPAVRDYIWNYGLRQVLNDACAPHKDRADKIAAAELRLANLYEGTLRKGRNAVAGLDEWGAEMHRLAKVDCTKAIRAKGAGKIDKDALGKVIVAHLAKNIAYYTRIAQRNLVETAEIDIGDLI